MTGCALSTFSEAISAVRPKKNSRAAPKPRPDLAPNVFAIVRKFDDGTFEFEDYRGYRRRGRIITCAECERDQSEFSFDGRFAGAELERFDLCNDCRGLIASEERAARIAEIDDFHRKQLVEELNFAAKRRSASLSLAKPKWRDLAKIREIYEDARRLTRETGIPHHVDHFYPLQGQFCCGLHIHQNLRVLPARENCSKNNDHPLNESPALVAMIEQYGQSGLNKWLLWAQRQAGITNHC